MKIPLICSGCMNDNLAFANFIASSELNDSGIYQVRCPRGHESYVVLQQQKFELLFDIGACALVDGYYREAVSSFTSSLERFHEFFIRAVFLQNGATHSDIESIWKHLARQSERQLGAYIALYMRECGTMPVLLNSKHNEFRNDVIHRGKIPSRSEAVSYGEAVLGAVRPALSIAKLKFANGVHQLVAQHLVAARQTLKSEATVATSCMPTILSVSNGEACQADRNLEKALTTLGMWNWQAPIP
ncbi:hypothetical protein [Bradyrhizobium sp. USDA 10063]